MAVLDGYLDSHRNVYISPSEREKCGLGEELLSTVGGLSLYKYLHFRKYDLAVRRTKYFTRTSSV